MNYLLFKWIEFHGEVLIYSTQIPNKVNRYK
jgi:hypothetical protein